MNYVVLDTDVASLSFRKRLPPTMNARLAGTVRDWAPRNQAALEEWLSHLIFIDCGWETARTWGFLSAGGRRSGRAHPINDTWIAACCLSEGLPLAALNHKDFADFADHHGLTLIGDVG